ncbi:hypothetical protein GCM10010508_11430 [Streptomyces naganishii JCM 4654]|uniref:Uncharacterized protein n=1 Tax=Streptomyces naganishii JCM 4654 TaxID=1306179 RepID=A0A918Y0S2_9ACTN|nr:hypothetical protein GCM10010508_11430 [Streptomyces naganishii JCM 4654]
MRPTPSLQRDRALLDGAGGLRIADPQQVQQPVPVRHAPAVGRALGVALVDGDVVGRVLALEQDGEIEAGGPATDTGGLHANP